MPWRASSVMFLRQEFINLLHEETLSFSELCRRYGISRKTGYKWATRFANTGIAGLEDASRRPKTIVRHIDQNTEDQIVGLRTKHQLLGGPQDPPTLGGSGYLSCACLQHHYQDPSSPWSY